MERTALLELFKTLGSQIAETDLSSVSEDSELSKLNIDSLTMLELVGAIEQELSIRVPDDSLVGVKTVQQLLDVLEARAAASR